MTFNPFAEVPAVSTSNVILSPSSISDVLKTAAVAAVAEDPSLASIVRLVLKILEPCLLISTVITPLVDGL